MSTPIGATTSYATPAQLLAHTDIRAIADCLQDLGARVGGTVPNPVTVQNDPNLQDALNKASGDVESACLVGNKYTVADLQALTGNSLAHLQAIVCDLATFRLLQRRFPAIAITEQYRNAQEKLERLRMGERIFALAGQAAAGLPQNKFITQATINLVDLSTTQARRFYGNRNKEWAAGGGQGGTGSTRTSP